MSQQQAVNFLPEDYVEKRSAQRWAVVMVGLFVLELAGIVGGYWYLRQRPLSVLQEENAKLDQLQELKRRELDEYKDMTSQREAMQTKVDLMAQMMERVSRSELLRKLHEALGKDTKFTQFTLTTKELPLAKPQTKLDEARGQMSGEPVRLPPTETTIEVMGLAPSHEHVAKFLERLGQLELVENAQPIFSEEYKFEDQVYRRFKVSMKISPLADTRFGSKTAAAGK